MRFHTTKYKRDKSDMPSPFAMKLRKHIRLKRLEDIRQLGSDRVVDMKVNLCIIACAEHTFTFTVNHIYHALYHTSIAISFPGRMAVFRCDGAT